MPRPTGRGFALLGLAVGAYVAGRMVGTWELYLFAFAFLATVIVSWLLVVATGRRIQVSRAVAPERPVAGDEPEFTFVVKNASLLPGPQLTLRSPMAGLSAEDLELEIESLAPRRDKVLKIHAGRVNRGVHLLPPVQAVAEDPLGIASAVHRVSDPLPVTVLPADRVSRILRPLSRHGSETRLERAARPAHTSAPPSSEASGPTSPASRSATSIGRARRRRAS